MVNLAILRAFRCAGISSLVCARSHCLPFQRAISPPASVLKSLIPQHNHFILTRLSHGIVNLVLSQGQPKFQTRELDPPKKEKWKSKKQLKLKRKREKRKRKEANRRDPRRLGIKAKKKKQRFQDAAERIKYKIEKAKIKEAQLMEKLKRYEIPQVQGPRTKPEYLTGEERFFIKKMAQKQRNYAQVGYRGIFGGVIQNMHMHWKKHETVKVICNKACKPGHIHEFAKEIERLSGGMLIEIIGKDTMLFYRGKKYVQPKELLPISTLSKKKAGEKSRYEQSLEAVRRFISISEKELELYYRHVALYGDPNARSLDLHCVEPERKGDAVIVDAEEEQSNSGKETFSRNHSDVEHYSSDKYTHETNVEFGDVAQ